jgi:hypothetical protein
MAAILNPKWSPKYKNPPIWAKFGFQVDYGRYMVQHVLLPVNIYFH